MQRSKTSFICQRNRSSQIDQFSYDLHMRFCGGILQRSVAVIVLNIDVSSFADLLHDFNGVAGLCCEMKICYALKRHGFFRFELPHHQLHRAVVTTVDVITDRA